jgi:hypothetical protein
MTAYPYHGVGGQLLGLKKIVYIMNESNLKCIVLAYPQAIENVNIRFRY